MKIFNFFGRLLLATVVLLTPLGASAQVTIGSGNLPSPQSLLDLDASIVKKGLHLPRLDSLARNVLTASETVATQGLAIFNTDTRCFEYWNQLKWISLCQGTADISLGAPEGAWIGQNDKSHPWDDIETHGPITISQNPEMNCGANPFLVTIISGSTFLSIDMVDESSGIFTYTLEANNNYNSRTAVVRVTCNCTGEYKDFLVNQSGNTEVCGTMSGTPTINVVGSQGVICLNGQAMLNVGNASSLTGVEDPSNFVWARNGIEVGRGTTFTTTQPGNYQLFLGGVGCPNASAIQTLTFANIEAPRPVTAIDAQNNGMICGGVPISLTAITHPTFASPETVQWLKDELPISMGGTVNNVSEVGSNWSAVVVNPTNGCVSRTSSAITIREGVGTQPILTSAGVLVNGATKASNPALCPGSPLRLEIGAPNPDLTYEWSVNGNSVGMGSIVFYNIPNDIEQVIISVVASGTGCITSVTLDGNLSATRPATPVINSSSSFVCAAGTLTLSTNAVSGVTYQWFRNGAEYATGNSITITNAGSFEVQASIGACQSPRSAVRDITLSGTPTGVTFSVAPATGIPGAVIPFAVTATNVETWEWSTDGRLNNTTVDNAEYQWATEGIRTVTATARNACGRTSTTTSIDIKSLKMTTPIINPVAVSTCGGGAQYQIDLNQFSEEERDILTGFNWTVTRANVPIPFITLGEKGSIVQFEYSGTSAVYAVSAVAAGVGRINSDPGNGPAAQPATPTAHNLKLRGYHLYDVARTGGDLEQRQSNIVAGGTYPYSIYNGGTEITTTWGSTSIANPAEFSFPAPSGATYSWSIDDPDGLASNAAMINGATTANINLTFSEAINSITNGQVRTVMLACVVTIGGCHYPVSFPIRVQDKFACGTGSYTTLLMGSTTPYGARTSQRSYRTYTFPTSRTDQTPKCWMIEDSAEGTSATTALTSTSVPSGCRNGQYAQRTDHSRGFHYWSSLATKRDACPAGWRMPVGGGGAAGATLAAQETGASASEMSRHFVNLLSWAEYKHMWFSAAPDALHGYNCTTVHSDANTTDRSWHIWGTNDTTGGRQEAWINKNRRRMSMNDSSHQAFSIRCVKDVY